MSLLSNKAIEFNTFNLINNNPNISPLIYNLDRIKNNKFTILFSPAAASFDEYKNFEERGTMFKKKYLSN